MLRRYTSEQMAALWSDESRYERWRLVELTVLAAQVRAGTVPAAVLHAAEATPAPSADAVERVEMRVRHDVVAFLDAWTGAMDSATASHIHRYLTSSDTVDTAQAIALAEATDLILTAGDHLVIALADRALEHQATLCVARTHGQAAAYDVVGHRLADFAFAVSRALSRLVGTRGSVAVANISGPVGAGLDLPPALVREVADALVLDVPPTTTQVVFRDAIAAWVTDLALLGAVCEAIATDVRIGQHDGISELAEPRIAGQEGSSAMPHKKNPITAENITGIARLLRSYAGPVLEDIALWQHRDITHSSVERVVLPDAAALCEHTLDATTRMVRAMFVDEGELHANILRAGGALASQQLQVELQGTGIRREEAAAATRARIDAGNVTSKELDDAARRVLDSETLAAMFQQLSELRANHSSHLRA